MLQHKQNSKIVAIYIAESAISTPMPIGGHPIINPAKPVQEAEIVAGMGIKGDRWFGVNALMNKQGVLIPNGHARNVTFFEEEMVKEIQELGFEIQPQDLRRNILVKKFHLNNLVGQEFCVGNVRFKGSLLSHGCDRLETMSGLVGINKALYFRGGIRAEALTDGVIHVGDDIKCC